MGLKRQKFFWSLCNFARKVSKNLKYDSLGICNQVYQVMFFLFHSFSLCFKQLIRELKQTDAAAVNRKILLRFTKTRFTKLRSSYSILFFMLLITN